MLVFWKTDVDNFKEKLHVLNGTLDISSMQNRCAK